MVKATKKSNHTWSTIFSVIVNFASKKENDTKIWQSDDNCSKIFRFFKLQDNIFKKCDPDAYSAVLAFLFCM